MASSSERYHTIPYPRNPGFYGRDDILQAIATAFEEQSTQTQIASVALWGTAGIGKTQIALEVAHRHWSQGEGAVLWIKSETCVKAADSFNDAARDLNLDGYPGSNNNDDSKNLVLRWIRNTDAPWLLIFDDVQSHEQLVENWPIVGRGKILITCQSEPVAESGPVSTSIEVPAFTVAESTELIFRILRNRSPEADEVAATNLLSAKLGGLALAVDIIARQIKVSRHFKSVADYLPHFDQNQNRALNQPRRGNGDFWYSKHFVNLWKPGFDDLSDDAAEMLGILCFVSPESIPMFLFRDGEYRYEKVMDSLLDRSLVRINAAVGLISVHRLIQESYFPRMTSESRNKASQLKWDQCDSLQQHVTAFNERYRSIRTCNVFSPLKPQYAELICDHSWYLHLRYLVEIQHFLAAEAALVSLLGDMTHHVGKGSSPLGARIQRNLMGLYERTGRSKKARAAAEIEYDMRRYDCANQGPDNANRHNDVGYTLVSEYKASEAITFLDRAVAIATVYSEPKCYQDYNIDQFLRNRGRCKAQLGQLDEALADFSKAEFFQAKLYGPGSPYDGETKYERAKLAERKGDLKAAEQLSREAQTLLSVRNLEHASVAAALYQRARIAMLRGKNNFGGNYNKTALQYLRQALAICKNNEPLGGNRGEAARVRWRMALVCGRLGRVEEAGRLREEAEKVKRELEDTGEYAVVPGGLEGEEKEEAGWDALVGLLYR
ncbi:P-loop containing nucleoside triphosphate hydrolase protein [Chaetomium tenue]|uniref:P-loop containing nucleoside triphosphate hydrolase protein n=1 Tax=Chaetomium tenue TaxID=1854479 RepID=A0ACB7P1L7_9PEZI|nr:P-loop containing nucleoside triphosphate hydrolase protein [Chaetomium globosum]